MKRIFGFGRRKSDPSLSSDSSCGDGESGYLLQDQDLGKIHRAASRGKVAKVQQILLLGENGVNDKDKKNRTALHLACANGHAEVVTLLVERKCQLNFYDNEQRTALMKAVQCKEEECATILLQHGADPDIMDASGNTALHYAVCAQHIPIAAKLLSYNANIEARNKNDFTPLLLAIHENEQQMVEFLVKKEANIHAVDKAKRTALMLAVNFESPNIVSLLLQKGVDVFSRDTRGWTAEEYALFNGFSISRQLISEYKEKKLPVNSSQNNNPGEEEHSEEDSLSRLSNKPGIDDSCPTSDQDFDFDTKTLPKPSLTKLMTACQQFRKNIEENRSIVRPENRTLLEDSSSDSAHEEDVVESLPKLPVRVQGLSHAAFPSPDPLLKPPLESSAVPGATKEGTTKPAIIEKEAGIGITESAPREQTNSGNMTSVVGAHKNDRSDMMPALGLGEKEDIESPWDSESISESLPQKYVAHLSEVTDRKGKNILNGQIEDSPEKYPHVKPMQPIVEMKDSAPNKAVRIKDVQTSESDWDSTSLTLSSEHCKTSGDLKVDDKCLFVSQSITKNQSASTEFGQMTLIDKEKFSTGTIFLLENYSLHDPCESQLSEKKESKEDLSAELDLKMKSEEEQERLDGSENNQPQAFPEQREPSLENVFPSHLSSGSQENTCQSSSKLDLNDNKLNYENDYKPDTEHIFHKNKVGEETKKHKRSEMEVSENLYAAAAEDDEDGFIQQRKSEKTDRQQFPIKDNDSNSSSPALHMKEVKKNENEKWTSKEPVITPRFEKTDSLTGILLQVNNDSILSEIDQEEERTAKKTSDEKNKVKKQINSVDDLDDLTQASETASEDCELPMLLIEQLGMVCKGRTLNLIFTHSVHYCRLKKLLKMTRKELSEYENGELSFRGDLKPKQIERDSQITVLKLQIDDLIAKLETSSSKCLHLYAKNQDLQQELLSVRAIQKRCEKLEKNKKKLEQVVVNLRSHVEMNMLELGRVEQYKQEIEERARQEIVEKLKEVNLFLQIQAASQEKLEQLRENNNTSMRQQMELRIKDLEYELSKMKIFQEDSNKSELERYKHLYLEELKVTVLSKKLNETQEQLAETTTKLLMEKLRNRYLVSPLTVTPVLEPSCAGNLNNHSVLNRNLIPRQNVVIPSSIPRPSSNSMETFFTKLQQELERNITREIRKAAADFELGSYRVPLV
ncbi:ankyrin repeat domain-containing protein 26-like [Choloepus didactylus]|uniref:ankyrin repeat domain-containing protein 26-like n=1 Tax=Choloepus didactylus TaxID=27675 RepID=UPI0018A10239|nr:ankyrin repeat domain-containing protein 26-like [Choloepus didactylus]